MAYRMPKMLRRVLRRVWIVAGTLFFGVLSLALINLGHQAFAERTKEDGLTETQQAALPPAFEYRVLTRQDGVSILRRFVGQVEAAEATELGFELPGKVVSLLSDEGDFVAEGDILARLDTEKLTNQRARLEEVAARISEIDAQLDGIRIDLGKSVLRAPFAGVLSTRQVDSGGIVAPGVAVFSLMRGTEPRVRVGLPPELAARLSAGDRAEVLWSGRSYEAVVLHKRSDLDPLTRTQPVIFSVNALDAPIGETAEVVLSDTLNMQGVWLPVLALREGIEGVWTILVVDGDEDGEMQARSEAVQIHYKQGERVFVDGTFRDGARAILDGHHRASPGQNIALIGEG